MFLRLVIFSTLLAGLAYSQDYCKVKCESTEAPHTVCKQRGCPVQGSCKRVRQNPLSQSEKNLILDLHNQVRQNVSSGIGIDGKPKSKQQPKAANMKELKWDKELEYIAQCWVNACQWGHDQCRNTLKNKSVGQNIAWKSSTEGNDIRNQDILRQLVAMWFNEVEFVEDTRVIEKYSNGSWGHYTQMVHANTNRIGCARIYDYDGTFHRINLYCNYAPAGNVEGKPVYKIGKPACQGSECSSRYPALIKLKKMLKQ